MSHLLPEKTGRVMIGLNPVCDSIGNSPAFISQGAGSSSIIKWWTTAGSKQKLRFFVLPSMMLHDLINIGLAWYFDVVSCLLDV